ncbi:MAG: HesA/MoeB/ThiF family protein [Bacteroidales bacterium]|nr:HesA/MoeB/ThiF family protein [Candidatus Minthousia equi]MDO4955932.1 HesA/MoeB/ThiF family protein [Bacteroidales bacterium]
MRYSRHILLEGFGKEGQQKLLQSKVLLIGAGGLGSPNALYLAAAGVGTIGIADADTVSLSNLQRQVIHFTQDIGKPKVESAAEKIRQINPDVKVVTYDQFISQANASEIISDYDFIIDCTDSFASKYLVNDACVMAHKPFCAGGVVKYGAQVMTHVPGSACYRCIFPEPPAENDVETCATVGVLGSVVGIMGSIQATEAIKYLTGIGELLTNKLLIVDALSMNFQSIAFNQNKECSLCGEHPTITELEEYSFQPCRKIKV